MASPCITTLTLPSRICSKPQFNISPRPLFSKVASAFQTKTCVAIRAMGSSASSSSDKPQSSSKGRTFHIFSLSFYSCLYVYACVSITCLWIIIFCGNFDICTNHDFTIKMIAFSFSFLMSVYIRIKRLC